MKNFIFLAMFASILTSCGPASVDETRLNVFFGTTQNSLNGQTTTLDISFVTDESTVEQGYIRGYISSEYSDYRGNGSFDILNLNVEAKTFDLVSSTWESYDDFTDMNVAVTPQSIKGVLRNIMNSQEAIYIDLEPVLGVDGTTVYLGSMRSTTQGEIDFEISVTDRGVITGYMNYFGPMVLSGSVLESTLEMAAQSGIDFGGLPNSVMVALLIQNTMHQVIDVAN